MTIFLITAPSGAGKTTIAHSLEKKKLWVECISHTSRPMRDGEEAGTTYYYTDKDKMADMIEAGEFAEHVKYDGNFYGVSHAEIKRVTDTFENVFIIVEHDGYLQIKEQYPDAVGIFLWMSEEDCLANMLLRGDKKEDALRRLSNYHKEMKGSFSYDYVIKNVRDRMPNTEMIIRYIVDNHSSRHNM